MRPGRKRRSVIARAAGRSEWLTYPSVREAAEALGVAASIVSSVCHGKLKLHSRGFEAKFVEAPDLPDERWVPLVDASTGKIVPQYVVSSRGRLRGPATDKSQGSLQSS
eukprot:1551225-Amphidinium_carterae.1